MHFTGQHRLESLVSTKHFRMGSSDQRHLDHHRNHHWSFKHQKIFACHLRSNATWIIIAHQSHCRGNHLINLNLHHRRTSCINKHHKGTIGVARSSPSGTTGSSVYQTDDGSTMLISPGFAPATFEPRLGVELNNETDGQSS